MQNRISSLIIAMIIAITFTMVGQPASTAPFKKNHAAAAKDASVSRVGALMQFQRFHWKNRKQLVNNRWLRAVYKDAKTEADLPMLRLKKYAGLVAAVLSGTAVAMVGLEAAPATIVSRSVMMTGSVFSPLFSLYSHAYGNEVKYNTFGARAHALEQAKRQGLLIPESTLAYYRQKIDGKIQRSTKALEKVTKELDRARFKGKSLRRFALEMRKEWHESNIASMNIIKARQGLK